MRINGSLNLKATKEILKNHGIDDFGKVQKQIDSDVIRYMSAYTPKDTGALIDSADDLTTVGSGLIVQGGSKAPYARKWYYTDANFQGKPRRGKAWFKRCMSNGGKKKILNNIYSNYGIKNEG